MSKHYKAVADSDAEVAGMMKLSLKFYRFLRDIEAILEVEFTPQQRAQALQLLKELGEDLKMMALAEIVLQEVQKPQKRRTQMRTLEEALDYLNYHSPEGDAIKMHAAVNEGFQKLMKDLWDYLPEGPGKTVAIRAIGAARMQCNSCIANKGT